MIQHFNDKFVLKLKITCSMRLSARRANDSRRPELLTGIVGGNGGVDMLKIYIFVCYLYMLHSYKIQPQPRTNLLLGWSSLKFYQLIYFVQYTDENTNIYTYNGNLRSMGTIHFASLLTMEHSTTIKKKKPTKYKHSIEILVAHLFISQQKENKAYSKKEKIMQRKGKYRKMLTTVEK